MQYPPPQRPQQPLYPQQQPIQPGPLGEQWHTPPQQQTPYPPQPYPPQPMQQPAPYPPGMQPMYPQQGAQPMMQQSSVVNVNIQHKGPSFLVRVIYYIFIGWWLGYFWLNLGFLLCFFIVTLPLGLIMLNRLPQVMTLRPAGTSTNVNVSSTQVATTGAPGQPSQMMSVQNISVSVGGTKQMNFFIRAIYYIFVGWWAGYIWANLAYLLCFLIVTLPVGLIMFNRLPMVLTLRRN
jgi:uncharacterized membrane protein YccF (DUF307 family)